MTFKRVSSQALREKNNDEKSDGKPPAGFNSPTLILPTSTTRTGAEIDAKEEELKAAVTDEVTV